MAKYYFYNDMKLPALPNIDIATYPYLTIWFFLSGVFLYAAKEPTFMDEIYNEAGTDIYISLIVSPDSKCWRHTDGAWEEKDDVTGGNHTGLPKWSNHDIIGDETGYVHFAASDPVPVIALTAHDLYRKINGKPTKLTLYKKVGGELVALDEYSAASVTAVQSNA